MTSTQMKRIRARLNNAARLTAEAYELATQYHATVDLREITARAADDMAATLRALDAMDARFAANAASIVADMRGRAAAKADGRDWQALTHEERIAYINASALDA